MAHDLKELFNSTKRLAILPGWAEIDSEFLQIVAPLEIDGITIEGLQFRACARKRLPDEMITCQVEYHPSGEVGGPLAAQRGPSARKEIEALRDELISKFKNAGIVPERELDHAKIVRPAIEVLETVFDSALRAL